MIKIMVIEDEKIERETLVKILEEHIPNVEVCQAMNGEEALQLYEKKTALHYISGYQYS